MKAIILSAGQGSRLGHLVDDKPKCLIDFNGRTLLDRHAVSAVVVGLPLDPDGAEGDAAAAARRLAADIAKSSGKPVDLWDERLSTARALQTVREMGGTTRGRKDDVDALAAAVLLQHYLDAKRGSGV